MGASEGTFTTNQAANKLVTGAGQVSVNNTAGALNPLALIQPEELEFFKGAESVGAKIATPEVRPSAQPSELAEPSDLALLRPANGETAPLSLQDGNTPESRTETQPGATPARPSELEGRLPQPGAGRTSLEEASAAKNAFLGTMGIKSSSDSRGSDSPREEAKPAPPPRESSSFTLDGSARTTARLAQQQISSNQKFVESREAKRQAQRAEQRERNFANSLSITDTASSSVSLSAVELDPQAAERALRLGIPMKDLELMSLGELDRVIEAVESGIPYQTVLGNNKTRESEGPSARQS
jgi:hypothetical protein